MDYVFVLKTQVEKSDGGIATAWNVVDERDGYIFETFNTKREAIEWAKSVAHVLN